MDKVGLVVEGGGTKIAYSAGVMKCLLDYDILLPYSVGISSGAQVLTSYVSRQPGRLETAAIGAASHKDAVGIVPFIKEGSLFGIESTNRYIEEHAPLDWKSFLGSMTDMEIGVYNLKTHEVEYFDKQYVDHDMTLVKASCALLLLAKPYKWNNRTVFDAGLVDMISINRSIESGCTKHLVLSTKEEGYKRKPAPKWQIRLASMVYHDPVIVEDLKNRHIRYEEQWETIRQLEAEGKALVLRPHKDLGVTRYTTDPKKLKPWFDLGYEETKERLDEIRKFCGIEKNVSIDQQLAEIHEKETVF